MVTYLDHAATSPLRPEARAAVLAQLDAARGNATGVHALARASRNAVEQARDEVADVLGCAPGEVVFTSGGTEADNLAVFGVLAATGGVAACSAIEHHAVLDPVLAAGGVTAPVTRAGVIDLDALSALLDEVPDVRLVSVMLVNNEVGTIQPLADVAEVVARQAPGAVLHTDAVQGAPWLDLRTAAAPAQLVAVSGHKVGGPHGVGVLVVREGTPLRAQLLGGGQERERRSGTHDVPGIAGLAAALRATAAEHEGVVARVGRLRDRLADGLLAAIPGSTETGVRAGKVAGSCHLLFEGVESEALLVLLDQAGVCASAASSCASGALEPSHVLAAMGISRRAAGGSLRLSLGAATTAADVDRALAVLPPAVARLREREPVAARVGSPVGHGRA